MNRLYFHPELATDSPTPIDHSAVVIATVGENPQIVICAIQALLARGETLRELVLVRLQPETAAQRRAQQQLKLELDGGRLVGLGQRWFDLEHRGRLLGEIGTNEEAIAVNRQLNELVSCYKNAGRRLHVVISGGSRLLALLLIPTAILNFDHEDQLWHVCPDHHGERSGKAPVRLHAAPRDDGLLVKVPTLPLGQYFTNLRTLGEQPAEVLRDGREEEERCRVVVSGLTPMQRKVLQAFASGLSLEEVASSLSIEKSTVHSHKRVIYRQCREIWGFREDKHLTYHFLAQKFGMYFRTQYAM